MTGVHIAVAVALALLTACSSSLPTPLPASPTPRPAATPTPLPAAPTPRPAASPSQNWEIQSSVSGVFAGISHTLHVSSTGGLTAGDARLEKQVAARLPESDLSELAGLVNHLQPPHAASHPSQCADCFNYDVSVSADDRLLEFRGDDVTLQDSGWQDLVGRLMVVQQDALSGKIK